MVMAQPASFLKSTIILGFVWLTSLTALGDNRPSILKVERRIDYNTATASPSLVKTRMPKFLATVPARQKETYEVCWKAPVSGLDPGVELRFDYRQERSKRFEALHIRYPFRVMGERKAVFELPEQALSKAGPVVEWQVSLIQGKRVLAQKRQVLEKKEKSP